MLLNPIAGAPYILLLQRNRGGNLKAYLPYGTTSGGQPMDKSVLFLSQTTVAPIYRAQRDGTPGWPGREIRNKNPVSGAHDSWHYLQMRSTRPTEYKPDRFEAFRIPYDATSLKIRHILLMKTRDFTMQR